MAVYGNLACPVTPSVLMNDSRVEVIGAAPGVVTFTVPASLDGQTSAAVKVDCNGQQTDPVQLALAPVSPGIFTLAQNGTGQGAVRNPDATVNGPSNPASVKTYLAIYATGFGTYLDPGPDGLQRLTHDVQAFIGDRPAQIQFAGHAPQSTLGLQQINVLIPDDAPIGPGVSLRLVVNGVSTQPGVTIAIQQAPVSGPTAPR